MKLEAQKPPKISPSNPLPKIASGGNWALMFCQMWCPRQVQQVHQVHQVLRLSWSPTHQKTTHIFFDPSKKSLNLCIWGHLN